MNASVPVIAARVMEFTWQPPAPTMRNGRITGYNLTCFITDTSRTGQISAIYPPQESYTLSGFRPGRQYICQTVAMNSAGNGPPGQITTTSSEDGKLLVLVT